MLQFEWLFMELFIWAQKDTYKDDAARGAVVIWLSVQVHSADVNLLHTYHTTS